MANEYLRRTPTSTGNRKVWTVAFWHKRNATSAYNNFYTTQGSSPYLSVGNFNTTGTIQICRNESATVTELNSTSQFKDLGSWMHIMVVWDTTASTSSDRAKLYVNGILQPASGTYPSQDYEGGVNRNVIHTIGTVLVGGVPYTPTEPKGEWTDYFFVDGQALTPDVFGYYKKGEGYISVGSTQSTDFKKGQWVPKAPKVIKSVINARGGFGVNGFYLPMNDSTNVGADLHCAPNSIIKLKGEDEPQPYYGAPTTTDAYVSQLRSDPYAANLILAVPGISTATGANLITNGNFESDISGWTASGIQFSHTYNSVGGNTSGKLMYFATGTNTTRNIYQNITTEVGKRYTLSFDASSDTASANTVQIDTTDVVTVTDNNNSDFVHHNVSFTATSTSTQIRIISTVSNRSYFDNFVVKQEDAPKDYSADIRGSGTNKTLTANGTAGVGYEIPSYYGSAMTFDDTNSANFDLGDDSDFDFGTDDFTIEFWRSRNSITSTESYFTKYDTGETQSFWFGNIGTGKEGFWWYDSSGSTNITSPTIAVVGQFDHLCAERHNGTVTLYINGVSVGSNASSTLPLNVTTHNVKIGANNDTDGTTYYPFNGEIKDLRVYKGVAKYKGGFDVPKPYTFVGVGTWRSVPDCTANNFATLNGTSIPSKYTVSEGSLRFTNSTTNWTGFLEGTVGFSTGKWYWETRADVDTDYHHIGIVGVGITHFNTSDSYFYGMSYQADGRFWSERNVGGAFATGKTQANDGDIVQVAVDMNDKKMWIGINGNWIDSGNPIAGTGENFDSTRGFNYQHYVPFYDSYGSSGLSINFGQNPTFGGKITAGTNTDDNGRGLFSYDVPTGFLALCEDNLPTPAIADPGDHFKTVLYTGSSSARAVTGVGFKPDLVWIKKRSTAGDHKLIDSVRGAGLILESNTPDIEGDETGNFSGFNNDGFDLTATTAGAWNESPYSYVAWCWKAGGAAVSNTDGTITSQVSVNQDAGFSIVSWTGDGSTSETTIGHGLNTSPKFTLIKARDTASFDGAANDWWIYTGEDATQWRVRLNLTTNGFQNNNDTGVLNQQNSGRLTFIANGPFRESSVKYIAYCWAEVEGYSKFGTYVGNGSSDGPFVYCGFKPAFVLLKPTLATGNWTILDSSRSSTNPVSNRLHPNLSDTEYTGTETLDLLSNGFKIRRTGTTENSSGETYIFAAFAESPFKTANAK